MRYLTLGKKIEPNLILLNDSLKQFGDEEESTKDNKKRTLKKKMEEIDWKKAENELNLFIEDKEELKFTTNENLCKLI